MKSMICLLSQVVLQQTIVWVRCVSELCQWVRCITPKFLGLQCYACGWALEMDESQRGGRTTRLRDHRFGETTRCSSFLLWNPQNANPFLEIHKLVDHRNFGSADLAIWSIGNTIWPDSHPVRARAVLDSKPSECRPLDLMIRYSSAYLMSYHMYWTQALWLWYDLRKSKWGV